MNLQSKAITPEEYQRWRNKRLNKIENNIQESIESLKKLEKHQRFVFDVQEFIYFLEGLRK